MKIIERHRIILALFLAGAVALGAAAAQGEPETAAEEPPITDEERALHLESFDHLWKTVRERHWDPDLGGIDWDAVRETYRPQVEAAKSAAEVSGILNDVLGELGQSHYKVIPKEAYEVIGSPEQLGVLDGTCGLNVWVVKNRPLVTAVEVGSPAAGAGVKMGWEVLKVDGLDMQELLEKVREIYADRSRLDGVLSGSVLSRLSGEVGEERTVVFEDGKGNEKEITMALVEVPGRKMKFGHLPAIKTWIKTRTLESGIGYVAFNHFLDPVRLMPVYNGAVDAHRDAPGLIVDVRGNGGGLPGMSMGMAAWFVTEADLFIGTVTMRDTDLKLVLNPREPRYTKPVAVLVDGLSASAAEFFAGGMQDLGCGRIFGTTTAGAALPSVVEKLPNGDGFQYAIANYVSAGGEELEKRGVIPDEVVTPDRATLLNGVDPVLDAAVKWILAQPAGKAAAAAESEQGGLR